VNGNLGSVALVKELDGKVLRPPFFKRYRRPHGTASSIGSVTYSSAASEPPFGFDTPPSSRLARIAASDFDGWASSGGDEAVSQTFKLSDKCRRGAGSPEMEKAGNDERKGHAAELTNC
jgi:hypothetical protein